MNYETTTTVDSSALVVPSIIGGLFALLTIVIFLLGFFSVIGYSILGFGGAAYQGPAAARA